MYTNYKEISDRNGFFEQGVKFQVPKKVADKIIKSAGASQRKYADCVP